MKIRDLLAVESIDLNGKVTGKNETLDAMVALMAKSGKINDVEKYRKGVYAREEEGTTGIGEGIAIPHCKSDAVSNGRSISSEELQPGDIVCYSSNGGKSCTHVGLYIGDGQIIHSANSRKGVIISAVDYSPIIGMRNVID